MENLTLLSQIADEFGMDRSNARKYALKKGFNFIQTRDPLSRQVVNSLTKEDAEIFRSIRLNEGLGKLDYPAMINGETGLFYLIQLIPELSENRVKLGFSNEISARLASHRTSSPTAVLIKSWDCKRTWERTAMDSATRTGCRLIANEVFECDSVDKIADRLDTFFSIMPNVRQSQKTEGEIHVRRSG